MSSLILFGAGLTAVGLAGRLLIKSSTGAALGGGLSIAYKGGFERQMSKSEACKILSVPMTSTPNKIRENHRRLMIANHPDKGGSPYIASKINEAKDLLDAKKK
ncbi:mitochondrial import inner membrane translocase subunit TIM14-like [Convolutriloba macropyga]|uniref:mitochondrial import inner membrane translocase subunit TIM14-like n=1 Tax=Convolutriloba macropyga TaxID=536237 RepID=UPI003F51FF9B